MTRAGTAAIAGGIAAVAMAAGCARVGKLSAPEIVARNAAARGGLDAWRKVDTMVWVGHIESDHAPSPSLPFSLEQKRPGKTRMEIDALGQRSVRVFDGVRGWKVIPTQGPRPEVRPFTPQEVGFAQAGHGIDGPLLDGAARGGSVTLEGVDEVENRKAYHLKLHRARGGDEDVWVDAETYLEVRHDRMADGPGGAPRRVSAIYGDYRAVDGLRIPFLIQTGGGPGATPDRMRIERVVLNPPLDDSKFENPAGPHLRRRMTPRMTPGVAPRDAPVAAAGGEPGSAPR
jgi:hypothetical protein